MKLSRFNHEGYNDPTMYKALTGIEKERKREARFRPMVYICSPYAENIDRNVANAQRYSRFAVDSGCLPIAPHLYFPQFLDDNNNHDRRIAMIMNRILMGNCSEVWVFGDRFTQGMEAEIRMANEKKKPIRYFTRRCKEIH